MIDEPDPAFRRLRLTADLSSISEPDDRRCADPSDNPKKRQAPSLR